ncbi:hypothetical protein PTSG_12370 [Salpingoeca rosetta]|uniref:RING-type domain-containing protein n=1 Tax=Salpingoeca rosetta (strain ATCC 50818 / BSB-021) TaxID=946362 RepID=F2UDA5_SALR5|nr:uncharacterized protein PTSG_12370 [Salpingoeca rosetta]EGD74600.1 hypothetical protein PTSG_12370 [Salpingoeca rosetta]|eukprot:XP_004992857.1 hypothetical protein PTSG_12370 [Salpingoeca rosetta]
MDVAEDVAGWDEAMFVHKLDNLLRCPICLLGIRDASMCPSQHIFCDACLRRSVSIQRRCLLIPPPASLTSFMLWPYGSLFNCGAGWTAAATNRESCARSNGLGIHEDRATRKRN